MTDLKKLSEEVHKLVNERLKLTETTNGEQCIVDAPSYREITDLVFNSCLDLLAKQSGEYKTAFVLFTGKEALLASDKPTKKLHPDDTEVKMIDHAALLSANAKLSESKSVLQSVAKERDDLMSKNAELQQRVKDLSDALSTQRDLNTAAFTKLQEAEKVVTKVYESDLQDEISTVWESARTYLQNKGV